ncbi:hypothetical protein NKR19_g8866 [Coniochaeta hoffmannii]|uniref:Uncharacterized protein n=1 Tax=Coniochaeta hoffmannii TaxID=91930 RepID=A0AA38VIK5_9PEZI|nr:hypothetical protein NKR19_g8866 [Coniochaeta hoffmannii]
MASSSAAAQPPSHLPCIRALHLNAASAAAVLDVAAAVKHDQETSGQQAILALRALGEAKTWSEVALSAPSWAKVSALRTQLISESDSLIPIVTLINPRALYLYEKAMVVQLNAGVAPLKSFLTMDQDVGLLIPLSPASSAATKSKSESLDEDEDEDEDEDLLLVTAWDETRGEERYRLALAAGRKAFVVSGTAMLRVEGREPLVAVVFCLASGTGGEG